MEDERDNVEGGNLCCSAKGKRIRGEREKMLR